MSNPAVAKWLEEIAVAKAKAQAKEQQQQQQHQQTREKSTTSIDKVKEQQQRQQEITMTTTALAAASGTRYGIIASYSLRTRKKQLRLVLPPEPRKPGPGECCGNDCEPCVNTIYWEDLAAHRERCRRLQETYESECRALLESEGHVDESSRLKEEEEVEEDADGAGDEDDGTGLSIRSFRPFKVLRKRYLSENTMLVVCDLPYRHDDDSSSTNLKDHDRTRRKGKTRMSTMFHLLIRFQQPDGQFLTKAFTPVDLSRLYAQQQQYQQKATEEAMIVGLEGFEDRMAFLVKLYPSPHATSDMFRALEVYNTNIGSSGSDEERKGVLFLRGPIQTSRDRQRNHQLSDNTTTKDAIEPEPAVVAMNQDTPLSGTKPSSSSNKNRIVMVAAGSGITPMYQILRALHDQQHPTQQHLYEARVGQFWEADEVDLIYCNRTTDDIWLRQELQQIGSSRRLNEEEGGGEDEEMVITDMTAGMTFGDGVLKDRSTSSSSSMMTRTIVRVQHVLSSSPITANQATLLHHPHHRFHTGRRITLDLLRSTLQQSQDQDEHLQILVCGPPLFNKDVSSMLNQLGYTDSDTCKIHILE
ncbi:hypothetical protein BGX29_009574 [Mortierella sp. GBA35]|nr:hypothetical protein BGX29_009574 [Mortierella sp. GBA35]